MSTAGVMGCLSVMLSPPRDVDTGELLLVSELDKYADGMEECTGNVTAVYRSPNPQDESIMIVHVEETSRHKKKKDKESKKRELQKLLREKEETIQQLKRELEESQAMRRSLAKRMKNWQEQQEEEDSPPRLIIEFANLSGRKE